MSALTGQPVDGTAACTGEISVQGRVKAVGGVPAKVEAARRAGLKKVFIPAENAGRECCARASRFTRWKPCSRCSQKCFCRLLRPQSTRLPRSPGMPFCRWQRRQAKERMWRKQAGLAKEKTCRYNSSLPECFIRQAFVYLFIGSDFAYCPARCRAQGKRRRGKPRFSHWFEGGNYAQREKTGSHCHAEIGPAGD